MISKKNRKRCSYYLCLEAGGELEGFRIGFMKEWAFELGLIQWAESGAQTPEKGNGKSQISTP